MKKIILSFSFLIPAFLYAQIAEYGTPRAFQMQLKSTEAIPSYRMKSLDRAKLAEEDSLFPSPVRYSVLEDVNLTVKEGKYTRVEADAGAIWQYTVVAPGAKSIQIIFDRFILPEKAQLFLYDPGHTCVAGAFTRANMQEDSTFVIADFFSDTLIIEYFEPDQAEFPGELVVGRIGQAYKGLKEMAAGDDYINVNCSEGYNWQNEKHAVCFITFSEGGSGYMCSGALINNLRNDGTPYFLTASHCISTTVVAHTMVAYFNYEIQGCTGIPVSTEVTLTGAALMTTYTQSDYSLLKLYSAPPYLYKPYYAGWDATGNPVSSAVGIHHPEGNPKKISVDYDPIVTFDNIINWDGGSESPPGTHWEVRFDAGKIAGGSSGSPLFSPEKKIIGQLHGGDDTYNYYGKLSYSFNRSNSGLASLKNYLDPDNTGKLTCDAYYPPAVLPEARFAADFNQVCAEAPVSFSDYSAFTPVAWDWSFSPSSFTFLEGTDRNSKHPVVSFNETGKYDVSLMVTNAAGTSSKTASGLISATENIDVGISLYGTADSCVDNFDGILMKGEGASSFSWEILEDPGNIFYYTGIDDRTITVKMKPEASPAESVKIVVKATGTHGSCTDTARAAFTLVKQINDYIKDAIPLMHGVNGPFSNCCSGIEEGEPIPPYTSCTGVMSWCDEYGTGEDIVEHSVWFTLEGPLTGSVTITSEDFDNELALYAADSYQDILDGNYTLLAANDDQTDDNPFPLLSEVSVTPGNIYWLQVDGSGGGTEGYFSIKLFDNNSTSVANVNGNSELIIYPQPVKDILHIRSAELPAGKYQVRVYSATGMLMLEKDDMDAATDEIAVPVEKVSPGFYLVKITGERYASSAWFIKE
jgi:PKD repeat protein